MVPLNIEVLPSQRFNMRCDRPWRSTLLCQQGDPKGHLETSHGDEPARKVWTGGIRCVEGAEFSAPAACGFTAVARVGSGGTTNKYSIHPAAFEMP